MNRWTKATLSATVIALALTGCSTNKEPDKAVYAPAPLIVADATPVQSSSKRSTGVEMNFKNISAGSYQYARFKVSGFDASGQMVRPKKGNSDSAYLRIAGPIGPGQTSTKSWDNTWAGSKVQCLSVEEVEIIFSDGSVEVASASRLLNNRGGSVCL